MTKEEKEKKLIKVTKRILRFQILTTHLVSNYALFPLEALNYALHFKKLAFDYVKLKSIKTE